MHSHWARLGHIIKAGDAYLRSLYTNAIALALPGSKQKRPQGNQLQKP